MDSVINYSGSESSISIEAILIDDSHSSKAVYNSVVAADICIGGMTHIIKLACILRIIAFCLPQNLFVIFV